MFYKYCLTFCGLSFYSLQSGVLKAEVFPVTEVSIAVISFMGQGFGILSKKPSPYPGSFMFFPMLSFRSFTVLPFTLRSVIHFEFIF